MKGRNVLVFLGILGVSAAWAQSEKVSFAKTIQPIFVDACADCHGPKKAKAKLDLTGEGAYAALVGAASNEWPTMDRVKPGDPEASYLWLKLDHRAPKGDGMPKGIFFSKRLPDDQLALIKRWIEEGAEK
jgi:mono/diheme cytochrome c family protein